jgi:hypothetical protein
MKTKDVVAKYGNRAEYLRSILAKTYPAGLIDKERLTYADIRKADSTLLEFWRLTNPTFEAALYPEADKQAELEKLHWQKFISTRNLTLEQVQAAKDAMDHLCETYPVFVNCRENQED